MSIGQPAQVVLVDVDEDVLDELVRVATSDASANEVTPPLTAGKAWTEARVVWFGRQGCKASDLTAVPE